MCSAALETAGNGRNRRRRPSEEGDQESSTEGERERESSERERSGARGSWPLVFHLVRPSHCWATPNRPVGQKTKYNPPALVLFYKSFNKINKKVK